MKIMMKMMMMMVMIRMKRRKQILPPTTDQDHHAIMSLCSTRLRLQCPVNRRNIYVYPFSSSNSSNILIYQSYHHLIILLNAITQHAMRPFALL